ncbi:hypothetical protein GCM10027046_11640 [Uliginosibacterium flavum]|uniref:Restriction endonuclease type IV Mrr domain-containing protein n=1 Tax=Uliginosibacterium flavum TaxID=1396831 RepID=A0ABV2TQI2_9RHOO
MIKDSSQKQKAIRYCVAQGYVPYMEAVVRYSADTADVATDITDVDVLGLKPASEYAPRRVLFDCKTQAKLSAVSRALWAAGLLKMVKGDSAFVILTKAAPEGHRLAAAEISVKLFSEKLFDNFAKSATINYFEGIAYLDDLVAWETFHDLGNKYTKTAPLVSFLTSEAPFEDDPAAGFRALLARLKQAEGEFDATKPSHLMLYGMVVSQAIVFLSAMTQSFNSAFDPEMSKDKFENSLKNYVWGGKEGYELRKRLHTAIQSGRSEEAPPLQFPSLDLFVEMQRSMLDAPFLIGSAALPVKDIAFRQLCAPREHADRRINLELTSNVRARQFALQTNRYIGSLSRLLKECADYYARVLKESIN